MVNDIVSVNGCVHRRETLERLAGSLDEEGHEAQPHAVVALLEKILVLLAQIHDRLHVHLIEGGEHGCIVLRINETLGNGRTQACHGDALLRAPFCTQSHLGRFGRSRLGRSLRCRLSTLLFNERQHVFLGQEPVLAGCRDDGRVETFLLNQLARCGRHDDVCCVC